ncbi:MAG: hypothetical protein OXF73_03635 [Gammaproteobacteria bacterium]|nr:hypothetical protein [Gammaproteobacteria bacterium]
MAEEILDVVERRRNGPRLLKIIHVPVRQRGCHQMADLMRRDLDVGTGSEASHDPCKLVRGHSLANVGGAVPLDQEHLFLLAEVSVLHCALLHLEEHLPQIVVQGDFPFAPVF